jgi:hypothetical protein
MLLAARLHKIDLEDPFAVEMCVTQIRAKKKQEALTVLTPCQLLVYSETRAVVYFIGHRTL